MNKQATILVNGEFPIHPIPLDLLHNASFLICCDGAVNELDPLGIVPDLIIGDMDSASLSLKEKYASRIIHIAEQNSNDLTKAVRWAIEHQFESISILGAGGKREDHCIANCFLLLSYFKLINATLYTNYGMFSCFEGTQSFPSFKGQQVSLFSNDKEHIESQGLMYPDIYLHDLWAGTLNECTTNHFQLTASKPTLVFQKFE